MKNIKEKLMITLFLVIILGIGTSFIVSSDVKFSENENRYLTQKPKFTWNDALSGRYEKQLLSYLDDQFPLREQFIKGKNKLSLAMGKNEIGGIYFSKNGALVEKTTPWEFKNSRFEENILEVKKFYDSLKGDISEQNLSVLIVPTSAVVYGDELAYGSSIFDEDLALSQGVKVLKDYNTVSLTKTFWDKHKGYNFYYLDHHWTSMGAKLAYEEWQGEKSTVELEKVSEDFRGSYYSKVLLDGGKRDSIYIEKGAKNGDLYDLDALKTKDKYNVFLGGNEGEVKILGNPDNDETLLLIKDSYGNSFVPFARKNYGKILILDLRYFKGDVKEYIKENAVSDVMTLYGINTLMTDENLKKLNKKLIGAI